MRLLFNLKYLNIFRESFFNLSLITECIFETNFSLLIIMSQNFIKPMDIHEKIINHY